MPRESLLLKHSGIRRTNIYGYGCQLRFRSAKALAEDVAFTKAAIDSLKSEVVLVGHCYGGVVISKPREVVENRPSPESVRGRPLAARQISVSAQEKP